MKFKPSIDKLFYIVAAICLVTVIGMTVVSAFAPVSLWVTVPVDLLVLYFLFTPLFGYVELREKSVFIKFGLILKKEIPYSEIRGTSRERKFHSDSMVSLKYSMEHINIKFGRFDMISVSVVDGERLIEEIEKRTANT